MTGSCGGAAGSAVTGVSSSMLGAVTQPANAVSVTRINDRRASITEPDAQHVDPGCAQATT